MVTKKDVLLYGMIIQADIFEDGLGSTEEDNELFVKAMFEVYGNGNLMSEEEKINTENIIEKDNKGLLIEYRNKISTFLDLSNKNIKIKQYYTGRGGSEGYKFELLLNGEKTHEIEFFPHNLNVGNTLSINGNIYKINNIYDCKESKEELEVVWYDLITFKSDVIPELKLS